jgi:hypothetical protein
MTKGREMAIKHVVDFDMYEDVCAARDQLAAELAELRAALAQAQEGYDAATQLAVKRGYIAIDEQHRGNRYRARALALLEQCWHWRLGCRVNKQTADGMQQLYVQEHAALAAVTGERDVARQEVSAALDLEVLLISENNKMAAERDRAEAQLAAALAAAAHGAPGGDGE